MFLFALGFLAALSPLSIFLYLGLLGGFWHGPGRTMGIESAEEVLRFRFTRGEITKEQFQEMMDELHRSPQ